MTIYKSDSNIKNKKNEDVNYQSECIVRPMTKAERKKYGEPNKKVKYKMDSSIVYWSKQ